MIYGDIYFFAVPIIPEFLYDIRHPDAPLSGPAAPEITTTNQPPTCVCPGTQNTNLSTTVNVNETNAGNDLFENYFLQALISIS